MLRFHDTSFEAAANWLKALSRVLSPGGDFGKALDCALDYEVAAGLADATAQICDYDVEGGSGIPVAICITVSRELCDRETLFVGDHRVRNLALYVLGEERPVGPTEGLDIGALRRHFAASPAIVCRLQQHGARASRGHGLPGGSMPRRLRPA